MIRHVLGSRASIGGVLGSGRGGAAAAWYLAGGVSAANCIAAYTPKGAASLAASYDNNAAPGNGLADGTYDAAPGVAPTFAAATGWTFDAASSQYLTTGITPASGWSMIIRFSDATKSPDRLAGSFVNTTNAFAIQTSNGTNTAAFYYSGTGASVAPRATNGTLAIAGTKAYRNGSDEGITLSGTISSQPTIFIGDIQGASSFFTGKIQAVAIYNVTLSAAQVAAISSAMSAL